MADGTEERKVKEGVSISGWSAWVDLKGGVLGGPGTAETGCTQYLTQVSGSEDTRVSIIYIKRVSALRLDGQLLQVQVHALSAQRWRAKLRVDDLSLARFSETAVAFSHTCHFRVKE